MKSKSVNIRDLCKGRLSLNNSKLKDLGKRFGTLVASFDLPAGHSCPAASLCYAIANRESGHITHGEDMKFLCYATKAEAVYKNTRALRWSNFDLTKDLNLFVETISGILESGKIGIVRIHSSGDFYKPAYYQAWRVIASRFPHIMFFGYTKLANIAKDAQQVNPSDNFKLVYSIGGKMDALAIKWNLVTSTVITPDMKLSSDTQFFNSLKNDAIESIACNIIHSDDYEAVIKQESFGIILH